MIIYTDEIIDNELIHYLDAENVSKFTTMKNDSIILDTEYNEEIVLGFINLFRGNKDSFITGFDKKSCEELYKPILDKLGNYLFNRCETKDNKWNGNTLTNNDFAHAKIYTFNDENKLLLGYHPTAAIVGYILHLLPETKAYYKKAYLMAERIINDVLNSNNITLYELKSFNIFLAKIKEENLFSDKIKEFENKLINYAKEMITIDFEDFSKAHPLDCYSLDDKDIKDMIDKQLDYIISNIAPHGLWDHKESWGYNTYVEEESAMIKWIGHETVLNYYFLKKFNRIEK